MRVTVHVYRDTTCEGESQFPLGWLDDNKNLSIVVPLRSNPAYGYVLDLWGAAPAGPADWLSVSAQLLTQSGLRCGPPVPAMLYTLPWDVPTVVRFPQIPGEPSVWTVTLRTG